MKREGQQRKPRLLYPYWEANGHLRCSGISLKMRWNSCPWKSPVFPVWLKMN